MSYHPSTQSYNSWATEPRSSRMGRRSEANPMTPLQDEPRTPLLTTPMKEEPTGTTTHPGDVSVQFLGEARAPHQEEEVPEDQGPSRRTRPAPARSAPAQMRDLNDEQHILQDGAQGDQQDHLPDPLSPHLDASTPMEQPEQGGFQAMQGPAAPAVGAEQPEPRSFPPMQGPYPPPGPMYACEAFNPESIARRVATIMMRESGLQMNVNMPPPAPVQSAAVQHTLYQDPALAGCQPLPMHPHTTLTLNASVPVSTSASDDHINQMQETLELCVYMSRAILDDFATVCSERAGDSDPDAFVKAADPALIAAAVTASSVLETLNVIQEVTGSGLLQIGLREIATSHPATFAWMFSKFKDVSTVFPARLRWSNRFHPQICLFQEEGFALARALLYQPRLQLLRTRAAGWRSWSSVRALDSQLEQLRLDYAMTQSTNALRRSRLQSNTIEVASTNNRMSNKKRPHEFREPFPRNRGSADRGSADRGAATRGRRSDEGQRHRFQRR